MTAQASPDPGRPAVARLALPGFGASLYAPQVLYPVATKTGPRYGAATEMAGAGTYHLSFIVSPPSSHGMMRQTGKDGVADWWKPITGTWIFTYPLSAK